MKKQTSELNKGYAMSILATTILLPAISVAVELFKDSNQNLSLELIGKWFIFYAVGFRLGLAGIRQITNPTFTAKEIFHLDSPDSFPILRELGFANFCFGFIGILSLILPQWRIVSAFGSGLYFGLAAWQHLVKKPATANEKLALVSDIFIFLVLLIYVIKMF